ncbi:nucleotidyltransferase domain-containing protein [bacterium]|nr:nucleotidyltransferase domain-containing protein [bacterium]
MPPEERPLDDMLSALQERAKELTCLYRVGDILGRKGTATEATLQEVAEVLPEGWQYPDVCQARIVLDEVTFDSDGYRPSPWFQSEPLTIDEEMVGEIIVAYSEERPPRDEGPFLREERRLLGTVAERVSEFVARRRAGRRSPRWDEPDEGFPAHGKQAWTVILDFLGRTDRGLLLRIARRMVNDLCGHGVAEAQNLLREFAPVQNERDEETIYENRPSARQALMEAEPLIQKTFEIAGRHLNEADIIRRIQQWINEDKTGNLAAILERTDSSLEAVSAALVRYRQAGVDESDLPTAVTSELRVSLLRRFFSEDLGFLNHAKGHVDVADFDDLVQRVIAPPGSRGRLGGKSAGLFIAMRILGNAAGEHGILDGIRSPRTWYVTSDAVLDFIHANDLEDLYNRKYLPIDQIRQDYPHIVQLFKNSRFPAHITKGLAMALDEFEDRPIVVRSSSLLEDSTGASFSGKYKSLFLANQGSKRERLEALQDAIAEVYASVFGPDPIEYRSERGLLDVHEEMAIMIQEVVGRRVGDWFLPSFSGVAFSNNDFRWSPRIRRTDGLLRMVPGLGTRAVDRLSDDYPVLVAPGQPGLRVNTTPDEIVRYSPAKADLINLRTGEFETVAFRDCLREAGRDYPAVHRVVSRWHQGRLSRPMALGSDYSADDYVVTFDGLVSDTPFIPKMQTLLEVLQKSLGVPVDLEFAADGEEIYLVQCRAQSYTHEAAPAPIPRDLPRNRTLFTAHRHISNGTAPNLTHIVYIDPEAYERIGDRTSLIRVGHTVGHLNQLLPKRQFILIGPGRWGSRGDIKLGVPVTYSDINNTAVLSEIARQKGGYSPDLSFGTHFFQDLVEAGIRYLPLYPDEEGNLFDHVFLTRSENLLAQLVPEAADLADVIRVIDVAKSADGHLLHVLMNGDLNRAVGLLGEVTRGTDDPGLEAPTAEAVSEEHWRWRAFMVDRIAETLDRARMGVHQLYVLGSTKNGTAGPGSDIDLLVHFRGTEPQEKDLLLWLDGWSRCLGEINYLRTGYHSEGLLDVHMITDQDIADRSSFAVKIDAITDAARPLLPPGDPSAAP